MVEFEKMRKIKTDIQSTKRKGLERERERKKDRRIERRRRRIKLVRYTTYYLP